MLNGKGRWGNLGTVRQRQSFGGVGVVRGMVRSMKFGESSCYILHPRLTYFDFKKLFRVVRNENYFRQLRQLIINHNMSLSVSLSKGDRIT